MDKLRAAMKHSVDMYWDKGKEFLESKEGKKETDVNFQKVKLS